MNIVLASASPRREELLHFIYPHFEVLPADVDETLPAGIAPDDAVQMLAEKKAGHICALRPNDLVIGADTIAYIDGEILGKPRDQADAARMLRMLSGRSHIICTGVAICQGKRKHSFVQRTQVYFYPLSDAEIASYLATGEPMGKAGSYEIQHVGSTLVERLDGDYFNVVGLPVARLKRELGFFGAI